MTSVEDLLYTDRDGNRAPLFEVIDDGVDGGYEDRLPALRELCEENIEACQLLVASSDPVGLQALIRLARANATAVESLADPLRTGARTVRDPRAAELRVEAARALLAIADQHPFDEQLRDALLADPAMTARVVVDLREAISARCTASSAANGSAFDLLVDTARASSSRSPASTTPRPPRTPSGWRSSTGATPACCASSLRPWARATGRARAPSSTTCAATRTPACGRAPRRRSTSAAVGDLTTLMDDGLDGELDDRITELRRARNDKRSGRGDAGLGAGRSGRADPLYLGPRRRDRLRPRLNRFHGGDATFARLGRRCVDVTMPLQASGLGEHRGCSIVGAAEHYELVEHATSSARLGHWR